jgi:uncharacterized protein (TIGR00730 family)
MEEKKQITENALADWGELEQLLLNAAKNQNPTRLKILSSLFRTVLKLGTDKHGTLNLKIATSVLKELRFSFKMFHPHRGKPKITMFGSARVPAGTPLYEFAKKFAADATRRNFMLITGGGPGIMAAGNEGATFTHGFGLNIRLPMEQSANSFIDPENKLINYKYFFTRKLFLVKEAAAFAFFPGGFGTFDEAYEVLTLLQTGKTNMIPIVMMEPPNFGFWTEVDKFTEKTFIGKGFISPEDKCLYKICHSIDEALDHIERFYYNFHSTRMVKDKLVIRLKRGLSQKALAEANKLFAARIAQGQPMVLGQPLPEEENEPELKDMVRLIFPFNRTDYGSVRRLVDFLNDNAL